MSPFGTCKTAGVGQLRPGVGKKLLWPDELLNHGYAGLVFYEVKSDAVCGVPGKQAGHDLV